MMSLAKVALALSLTFSAAACGGFGKTPEQRALARVDAVLDDLDATPAQRASIRASASKLTSTLAETRAVRGSVRSALVAQLAAPRADGVAVTAQADEMTASLGKSAHAFIDTGAVVHATLTPAQRQILSDKMKPGRGMKTAFYIAGRMGFGPASDANEGRERAAARVEKGLDAIDATDAQRRALRPLAADLVDDALPLLDERAVIVAALQSAWSSERPDVASLHALADSEVARVNAVARSAADAFVQTHAILTPAQREGLAKKLAREG